MREPGTDPSAPAHQDKPSSAEETTKPAWSHGSGTRLAAGVLGSRTPYRCVPVPHQQTPCLKVFFMAALC